MGGATEVKLGQRESKGSYYVNKVRDIAIDYSAKTLGSKCSFVRTRDI